MENCQFSTTISPWKPVIFQFANDQNSKRQRCLHVSSCDDKIFSVDSVKLQRHRTSSPWSHRRTSGLGFSASSGTLVHHGPPWSTRLQLKHCTVDLGANGYLSSAAYITDDITSVSGKNPVRLGILHVDITLLQPFLWMVRHLQCPSFRCQWIPKSDHFPCVYDKFQIQRVIFHDSPVRIFWVSGGFWGGHQPCLSFC